MNQVRVKVNVGKAGRMPPKELDLDRKGGLAGRIRSRSWRRRERRREKKKTRRREKRRKREL